MTTIKLADAATEAITLAEAKAHLRVDDSNEDTLIGVFISAARNACEARTGRAITPTTYRMALDTFPETGIELAFPRLISVESVKYYDLAGVLQTVAPADYLVDVISEPGWVSPGPGLIWPEIQERINAVLIDYTAGYSTVPTDLKAWMLLAITDLFERRGRSSERPAVPQAFADGLLERYKVWAV